MTAQNASTESNTLGPIDLLVIEFPGNKFTGAGLNELHELVAAGTIRILDLVVVTKNEEGEVSALELQGLGPNAQQSLVRLQAVISQMLTSEDVLDVGQQLSNNTTAAVMLYENTWAVRTKQAIMKANGRVVLQARIPHEVVQQTVDDLAALGATVS